MARSRLALTELHLGITAAADPLLTRAGQRLAHAWAELEVLLARASPPADASAGFERLWFLLDIVIDAILNARPVTAELLEVAELAFLPLRDLRRTVEGTQATVGT